MSLKPLRLGVIISVLKKSKESPERWVTWLVRDWMVIWIWTHVCLALRQHYLLFSTRNPERSLSLNGCLLSYGLNFSSCDVFSRRAEHTNKITQDYTLLTQAGHLGHFPLEFMLWTVSIVFFIFSSEIAWKPHVSCQSYLRKPKW